MNFIELLLLALGVSADAFAVAICLGLNMKVATWKKALIVGLYFGIFQAVMPLIGYFTAIWFAEYIVHFDHWIAFGLLLLLGVKMIIESFKEEKTKENEEQSLSFKKMIPFAVATSIDALAVGISLAFIQVEIFSSVAMIGAITFALSVLAVKIGKLLGSKFEKSSVIVGGVILILIGLKILLNHLGLINF